MKFVSGDNLRVSNMEKKWEILKKNTEKVFAISSCLPLISNIAPVLVHRGIDTLEKLELFVDGSIENLYNPFLFADMQKAVERIRRAIELNEVILVYGDRDVDGVTAVNVIVNTINFLGGVAHWYVPANERYGIHRDVLSKYLSRNVKVLITVDCGISSVEEIAYVNKMFPVDVILTDHHEPHHDSVPNAYAVINPKTYGSKYPFKDIAGCVVALKTMQALLIAFSEEYNQRLVLCYAQKNKHDFLGSCIFLENDLIIEQRNFKSALEVKQIIKNVFKFYTNNVGLKDILVKENFFLENNIVLIGNDVNNISTLMKIYKMKKFVENNNDVVRDFFKRNLDLCALGTIADSMPLVDENRIIVKEGLRIIESHPHAKPGLGLLIDSAFTSRGVHNVTAKMVSWNITPVLNSSGRMARGTLSVQLLMTKDESQAKNLYDDVIKLNKDRRWLQFENIEQFNLLLKEQCDIENDKVLIVRASNLSHGVTGIVALQMAKMYSKPAFLFITDGKEAIGAARSVNGFDLVAALENVRDILIRYGGHSQAAGFTLEHSKIDEFTKRLYEYVERSFKLMPLGDVIIIENELKISDVNIDLYKQLKIMEPFGTGNLSPIFCVRSVTPAEVSVFGSKNKHLKFKISQRRNENVQAVFWNKSELASVVRSEKFLDIAFHVDMVNKNVQLNVVDIKKGGDQ
jgi:single-stranded-DNA-specific exonuclease